MEFLVQRNLLSVCRTTQKMKFSTEDFSSRSHLLKKYLMENFFIVQWSNLSNNLLYWFAHEWIVALTNCQKTANSSKSMCISYRSFLFRKFFSSVKNFVAQEKVCQFCQTNCFVIFEVLILLLNPFMTEAVII